jgi:hypothetical protein
MIPVRGQEEPSVIAPFTRIPGALHFFRPFPVAYKKLRFPIPLPVCTGRSLCVRHAHLSKGLGDGGSENASDSRGAARYHLKWTVAGIWQRGCSLGQRSRLSPGFRRFFQRGRSPAGVAKWTGEVRSGWAQDPGLRVLESRCKVNARRSLVFLLKSVPEA